MDIDEEVARVELEEGQMGDFALEDSVAHTQRVFVQSLSEMAWSDFRLPPAESSSINIPLWRLYTLLRVHKLFLSNLS